MLRGNTYGTPVAKIASEKYPFSLKVINAYRSYRGERVGNDLQLSQAVILKNGKSRGLFLIQHEFQGQIGTFYFRIKRKPEPSTVIPGCQFNTEGLFHNGMISIGLRI